MRHCERAICANCIKEDTCKYTNDKHFIYNLIGMPDCPYFVNTYNLVSISEVEKVEDEVRRLEEELIESKEGDSDA